MATLSSLENSTRLYVILDIPNFSSAEQIRTAYKSMALRYHPDKNIGDPSAVDRFREVQMAYEILSDETRRRRYDVALRMATREGGNGAGTRGAGENPYMRGMGGAAATGANFNANIYDELNRYAARAAKARTASAARTGVGKGTSSTAGSAGTASGGGSGAYASGEHTSSQYTRAQQDEFRRRERERNAEMKRQRDKEKRDQRDRDRDALRREQARQEEQLQQQWQQQQKAFAAAQSTRTRTTPGTTTSGTSATTAMPATPRTGRGVRSKTPPPPATADDTSSVTPEKEPMSTPPPDSVPVRRSRPASAAPGQQQRGTSSRRPATSTATTSATTLRGASVRTAGDDDDARLAFSPRPVNPNSHGTAGTGTAMGSAQPERFLQTSSATSEETTSASTTTATMRRAHTPGRPNTPRTASAAGGGGGGGFKGGAEGPMTPRAGGNSTARTNGTPVRPNPLSNEDKQLLGRQRTERARQQRGRPGPTTPTTTTASTTTFTPASPPPSASVSPQPSLPREDSEMEQQRLNKTKQRMERERVAREAKLAASETLEHHIGYLIEDEMAERQQLIEREELLARQRLLRTYQGEYQTALLTSVEFVQLIDQERQARAKLDWERRVTREMALLVYSETMDRLHVESLDAAVRRRLYGRRAADAYHLQRAQGQREVVCLDETRQRKALRQQEAKQATWMLEVMGPEFFSRCLVQEDEVLARRRLALLEMRSEYESQSPPRRSPSATPHSPTAIATATEAPRRTSSSVPDVIVASRRTSAHSPLRSPSVSLSSDLIPMELLLDPTNASPEARLATEETYNRYVLEHSETNDFRHLLRHRANETHALYEADKATALDMAHHTFEVQLRALRAEVVRLQQQQQAKRSGTPSVMSELEDSTNASASTSRVMERPTPDLVGRRPSNSGVAPHAPSPTKPALSPPAGPTSPARAGVRPATALPTHAALTPSTTSTVPPPPTFTASSPAFSVGPARGGSALTQSYLATTGQRVTTATTASSPPRSQERQQEPPQATAPRVSPSPMPVASSATARSTAARAALRPRTASQERSAAKVTKATPSPTRKPS